MARYLVSDMSLYLVLLDLERIFLILMCSRVLE